MKTATSKVDQNNKNLAGQQASNKEFFGEAGRYAVYAVHTRFDAVSWFVDDAMVIDDMGFAETIRQCDTKDQALKGLPY